MSHIDKHEALLVQTATKLRELYEIYRDAAVDYRGDDEPKPPSVEPGRGPSYTYRALTEPFVSTVEKPNLRIDIPLPADRRFSSLEMEFEFHHPGWNPEQPDGLHTIFWLHRKVDWLGNVIGYLVARGPRRNVVRLQNNIGFTAADKKREMRAGVLRKRLKTGDYHMYFRYATAPASWPPAKPFVNPAHFEVDTVPYAEISHSDGVSSSTITANAEPTIFSWEHPVWVVFGNKPKEPGEEGPEVTSPGWKWWNLKMTFHE